ncbi:HK97 family phage prohead protease, partial [Rhizobiaceae sp. 2RAB30]
MIATEYPYRRYVDGFEILQCSPQAINLDDMAGKPVLDSHQRSVTDLVGCIEAAWFEGASIVARIRLSASPEGQAIAAKIQENVLCKLSVGYRVEKATERKRSDGLYDVIVERWTIFEVSLVSVPADPYAKIRSQERMEMDPEDKIGAIDDMTRRQIDTVRSHAIR